MSTVLRIDYRGVEKPITAILLFPGGGVIVAQPVIERKRTRNLPTVLSVKSQLVLPELGDRRSVDLVVIDGAQQEAGIGKSDGAAGARGVGRVQVGETRFRRAEVKNTVGIQEVGIGVSFNARFSAELEGVVVLDPGKVGIEVGLFF